MESREESMTDPAPLWRQIRDALAEEIAGGRYAPGAKLPSEAALALRFGVNRHTVRRALGALAEAEAVHTRRGAGAFVTARPIGYRLGPRTRLTQNLAEAGLTGRREILRLETLPCDAAEAAALGLAPGDPAHVYEGVAVVEDAPFACSHGVFPAAALPSFPAALRETGSITAALAADGVRDYRRRSTRLSAERAPALVARRLHLRDGAPVLRATALDVTPDGAPVSFVRTWFPADRVELVVEEAASD